MNSENKYFLMSETINELLFSDNKPDKKYFYYIDKCPLCNSKKLKTLFKQWEIKYYKCKECDFVFSNPRLSDEGAYVWYNSEYYNAAMKTEHYKAEKFSKYYSISLNDFHFNKFIEIFSNYNFPKSFTIADIGCGSGAVLHYIKDELGYTNIKGFDLNTSNIDFAREFRNIEIDNVDIYTLEQGIKFDVIITTENIEHVSNPIEYLNQIKKLIKPAGFLFLTTPHNDKKATKLMGLSGDHFCAPNHQNYFSINNLSSLLNNNSFNVLESWIDDTNEFNLYAFIKRFLVNRDQVTAFPPLNAQLKTLWKWKRNNTMAVSLTNYDKSENLNKKKDKTTNKISIKNRIKKLLADSIPIKFYTHQIIAAQYNGK